MGVTGRLEPTWHPPEGFGPWFPVDVALDYLIDSAYVVTCTQSELERGWADPTFDVKVEWGVLKSHAAGDPDGGAKDTVYVACQTGHPIYSKGYDDHIVHIPTVEELAAEQLAGNVLWGAWG